MKLQSDPTVIFALTKGEAPLGRALLRADPAGDDPYNTYAHPGLPPGPIPNPGTAAIAPVLPPAPPKQLYFVARRSGGRAERRTVGKDRVSTCRIRRSPYH